MTMFILLFILYGSTPVQSDGVRDQTVYQEVNMLEGYNITSSILDDVSRYETMTPIACGIRCSKLENCLSFFYNPVSKQCQFHSEVFLANTGATPQAGTQYFCHVETQVQDTTTTMSTTTTTTTTMTTTTPIRCPTAEGFEVLGSDEMCVKFHTDKKTWFDANATCANYSASGHLAVVDTEVKNDLVKNAGENYNSQFSDAVFFGLATAGWVDGSPLVFTFWALGVVQNPNECASFQRVLGWIWNSMDCTALKHYVCEIPI